MKFEEARRVIITSMGGMMSKTDKERLTTLVDSLIERFGSEREVEEIKESEWLQFQVDADGNLHPTTSAIAKSMANSLINVAGGEIMAWPTGRSLATRIREVHIREKEDKYARQRIPVPQLDEDGNLTDSPQESSAAEGRVYGTSA